MTDLVNAIKRHTQDMLAQLGTARVGTVASVNPAAAQVKLLLQPDAVETGWLPVAQMAIGAGWGAVWMPNVGDQAVAVADSADADSLIVMGYIYSTAQTPPAAPANELWLVHQSGSAIKLHTGGAVEIDASGGLTINGNVIINGTLSATGNITADSGASHVDLAGHTHSYIPGTGGSAQTAAPTAGT